MKHYTDIKTHYADAFSGEYISASNKYRNSLTRYSLKLKLLSFSRCIIIPHNIHFHKLKIEIGLFYKKSKNEIISRC